MPRPLRILLIDDNPDDRALVIRELRRELGEVSACEVRTAKELGEALNQKFDLVITDYQLRWTDGLTVLREIKKRHSDWPVIMFTGTGSEEIAVQAMKAGLEDYVLKSPKHYARLASTVRSVLEKAHTETRVDGLERRLHGLLDRLNVGVFRANSDGLLLEANPAFLKLVGWPCLPPECYLRELYFRPEIHADHLHRLKQTGELREYEVELCRSDGTSILISMNQTLGKNGDDEPIIDGLVEDISQRAKIESELRQAQKLESIGRLAAGVAHDFNNVLTIIEGYASLLAERNFDAETGLALKNIASAADRAALLTRQLLAFSRKQTMQTASLDINSLIHNFTNIFRHILGDHISLEINCTGELPNVRVDEGMLQQALMNLAMNARDAMPQGGRFVVTSGTVELEREYIRTHWEARPGRFVYLALNDTGVGIAPENLDLLFEPFFSTKEFGKGTGLGLAAVYGIVKQHKGWIEVVSNLGKGTSFRIFLPAEEKPVAIAPVPTVAPEIHETVLLVEDEPELLELVGEVLQGNGYHVIPALDGGKALELWTQSRQKIDLLVTDMKMPGVGGVELAQTLVAKNPHLKVLYTSGYSPDGAELKKELREGDNYLQKPYRPEGLLVAVRKALE